MSLSQLAPSVPQTVHRPPCPKCGGTMLLRLIEPLAAGFDQRSFECKACDYADRLVVSF